MKYIETTSHENLLQNTNQQKGGNKFKRYHKVF